MDFHSSYTRISWLSARSRVRQAEPSRGIAWAKPQPSTNGLSISVLPTHIQRSSLHSNVTRNRGHPTVSITEVPVPTSTPSSETAYVDISLACGSPTHSITSPSCQQSMVTHRLPATPAASPTRFSSAPHFPQIAGTSLDE